MQELDHQAGVAARIAAGFAAAAGGLEAVEEASVVAAAAAMAALEDNQAKVVEVVAGAAVAAALLAVPLGRARPTDEATGMFPPRTGGALVAQVSEPAIRVIKCP